MIKKFTYVGKGDRSKGCIVICFKKFKTLKNIVKCDRLLKYFISLTCICRGGYMLDVGCGQGEIVHSISNYQPNTKVIGLDVVRRKEWKENDIKRRNVEFIVGDACNLPIKSDVINVVGCIDALEHMYYPEKCLIELSRILIKEVI